LDNQKHSNFCEISLFPVFILTLFNRLNNCLIINPLNLVYVLSVNTLFFILFGNIEMTAILCLYETEREVWFIVSDIDLTENITAYRNLAIRCPEQISL
jgi:hypothetical protein